MITEKSLQDIIGYVFLGSACAASAIFGFYILRGGKLIGKIKDYYHNLKQAKYCQREGKDLIKNSSYKK
jgi:hypothetical protein